MPEGGGGRADREGESTPGLGSSPFRTLLSLVRTGRCPVPTARPPSSAPQGLGKDVGKQEKPEIGRDRDAERHRDRYKGESFSQKQVLKFIVSLSQR